ncbi:hypothetical protein Tco_0251355 [Tanacetum coccineum]
MCLSSGTSKKTKISKNMRLLGSGSSATEDELKRKVDEEAAAKARAEEEDSTRKSNEKTTKKKIKEAKREARKKLAKKTQPEKDTEENVSKNEDEADNKEDADNNEENDDNEEDADNNEEDDENEEDADNNEEDDDNEEDADNEDQADNEENVDQVFRNIKTLPFLNATKRSKKKEDGKDKQNEAEDDEDVKQIQGTIVMMKGCMLERQRRSKKGEKKSESSSSRSYLIKQSKNDIEEGENNQSEEEEGDRKLTKDKMDKGLKSESEGDEQLKKVTKPKKGKGSKAEKPYPTYPQKKCLKDMGFERMIHFPIVELPSALAYHAIDHFHPGSMELRLEKGSIKATRQKVHDMLGIPMGSRKLEDLEERPSNDPFIKEWEKQFKHVPKPTPAAIASVLSDTTEADFMFRMNFITLFGSTMGTLDNGGRVSMKLLKRITKDVDILQTILRTCQHIEAGNTEFTTMKKGVKMETETNAWEKLGNIKEVVFDPEEGAGMGLNVYKRIRCRCFPQEFYEKIIEKFHKIMEERLVLVRTLTDGVAKFEHDQTMLDFCKEYKQTFNDAEFNLYESSNDEDSEGDVDGDNDKNNNDDDGAPTADANKKKESENQKKKRNKEEIDKQTEESGSEGTEESGSKGTEENGSEATEGGSDGKEENMNGDEREVTAQMDVDNQNKELNKEKDANETEDNDKMNNNDMKNDSVQEKQDTDKDENAKVDNVEEKQGDHKDEIGEDEFWNTQFTDSQCEELENQAKEEIKKKKTAKRKSTKEMTPPSFSLGISPDTNKLLVSEEGSDLHFILKHKKKCNHPGIIMQTLAQPENSNLMSY